MRMIIWMFEAPFGVKAPPLLLFIGALLLCVEGCGPINPHCAKRLSDCEARCQRLRDPKPCEIGCEEELSSCSAQVARRTGGAFKRGLQREERVMLVDFAGRAIHSPEVDLKLGGGAKTQPLWLELPPNGTIAATFKLPEGVKAGELLLNHAPNDHRPVFLTITVDETPLASRYSPPKRGDGQLKIERWSLAAALSKRTGARPVKIFIFNNGAAGSAGIHRVKELQLVYEEIVAPKEGTPSLDIAE